ncbi:MAG: YdcF family protein [Bryobacteraceae bacterium]
MVLVCGVLLVVFTSRLWLTGLGNYLVDAGPPAHAELVVVLAGDSRGNRILKAAELVKNGYAPLALVSGPDDCCFGLHESDLAIPFAVKHGYPPSYFLAFPHNAHSTLEEEQLIVPELRRRGVHSIDLVTSNYHTHRAGRIFQSFATDFKVYVVAAPDPFFTPDTWWKTREGKKTFLQEWAKTIARW